MTKERERSNPRLQEKSVDSFGMTTPVFTLQVLSTHEKQIFTLNNASNKFHLVHLYSNVIAYVIPPRDTV